MKLVLKFHDDSHEPLRQWQLDLYNDDLICQFAAYLPNEEQN